MLFGKTKLSCWTEVTIVLIAHWKKLTFFAFSHHISHTSFSLIIDISAETLKIFMKIYQDMKEDSFLLRKQKEKMQKVNKIRTLICWNSEIDNKDLSK